MFALFPKFIRPRSVPQIGARQRKAATIKRFIFHARVERLDDRIMMDGFGIGSVPLPDGAYDDNHLTSAHAMVEPQILGDANRDGHFDRLDLLQVTDSRKYLAGKRATWSEGDWNGDGVFDSSDFVLAFGAGNYIDDSQLALSSEKVIDDASVQVVQPPQNDIATVPHSSHYAPHAEVWLPDHRLGLFPPSTETTQPLVTFNRGCDDKEVLIANPSKTTNVTFKNTGTCDIKLIVYNEDNKVHQTYVVEPNDGAIVGVPSGYSLYRTCCLKKDGKCTGWFQSG